MEGLIPMREAIGALAAVLGESCFVDDCIDVVVHTLAQVFGASTRFSPAIPLRVVYEVMCGMAILVLVPRAFWMDPGTPIGRF